MTVNWVTELVSYSESLWAGMTMDGVKYLGAFVGAFVVAIVVTPVCREVARAIGMVDQPSARRINTTPIPRGGGLAIIVAFHLVLFVLVLLLQQPISKVFSYHWQRAFLLGSLILAIIGLVDDRRGLSPWVKLAGQVAVALLLYVSGVRLGGILVAFPLWLDCLMTVLWIVGVINAFNLIDGMDGLASGLALIASLGLIGSLLFSGQSAATLPYLVLAGACLGFLRYNFHPATVFLGDTGSMFLGLCLAMLPLMTGSRKELAASLGMPLLVMGIPLFDTFLAIWRRSVRAWLPKNCENSGKQRHVMQPDKDHLHHRLLRETMNQKTASMILYVVSVVLVGVGLVGTALKGRAPGLFLIAFMVAVYVVVRHLERVELWDTGKLLSGKRGMMRQGLLVPLYILSDVLSLCVVWIVTQWESGLPLTRAALLGDLPMFVVPVFLFLAGTQTYARVWSRAQIRDFVILGLAVMGGSVVAMGLVWLLNDYNPDLIRFTIRFMTLAILPLSGIRVWQDSIRGIMQILESRVLLERPGTLRFLAYGGGPRFRCYLRELTERTGQNDRVIIGLIDDEPNLKGRIIAGVKVLCGEHEIKQCIDEYRIDGVIITCLMSYEKQSQIAKELEKQGILVSVWNYTEDVLSNPKEVYLHTDWASQGTTK